jgi:hypothetical protein
LRCKKIVIQSNKPDTPDFLYSHRVIYPKTNQHHIGKESLLSETNSGIFLGNHEVHKEMRRVKKTSVCICGFIATAKVVRTQTEDKTIEIKEFQGFPLLPAPCYITPILKVKFCHQ